MESQVTGGSFRYYAGIDIGTHGSGFSYLSRSDETDHPHVYEYVV